MKKIMSLIAVSLLIIFISGTLISCDRQTCLNLCFDDLCSCYDEASRKYDQGIINYSQLSIENNKCSDNYYACTSGCPIE